MDLSFALLFKEILNVWLNKLLPIFFSYINVFASIFQLFGNLFAEYLGINCEGSRKDIFKWLFFVIIKNILETWVNIWLP